MEHIVYKFYALTLDSIISHILGIKSFIVELVIKISSEEITNPQIKTYLQKLNLVLVQVKIYINVLFFFTTFYNNFIFMFF